MPPPSALAIATSSVQRLVKEEASYHKELASQESRLSKLETSTEEDENREWSIKQQKEAIRETQAVFPPLRQRIADAVLKLEDKIESVVESGAASEEELIKAREFVEAGKEAAKKSDSV